MMKVQAPRIRIRRPKKRVVIISLIALLVLGLGVYGFFSYTTWRDLDTESKQVSSSLKTAVDEALGVEKETISPVTEMKTLVSDFDATYSEAPCDVSPLFGWQTVIPQVRTIADECNERFSHALQLIAALKVLTAFIEQEEATSTLLTDAIAATSAPTDYITAAAVWQTASESANLTNAGAFQTVATKVKEVSAAVAAAYTSLDTASKNEDKAAFDEALTALTGAYGLISEVATLTTSERQPLITTVTEAYDQL